MAKIYVGNLPFTASEADVRALFSQHGSVDAVTSDEDRLPAGRWTQEFVQRLASAQRRGHKVEAKRIHRKAARCRLDALHQFSREMVDRYQNIVVGDVSSLTLVKTRMAKSVLDSGWRKLKNFLDYKSQQDARGFKGVSERHTSVTCSACGARKRSARDQWVDCKIMGLLQLWWVARSRRQCGSKYPDRVQVSDLHARERALVLADSAEHRILRSRGSYRTSQGGGMRTETRVGHDRA